MDYKNLYAKNEKNLKSLNPKGFLGNYIYGTVILIVAAIFAGVGVPLVVHAVGNITTGVSSIDSFSTAAAIILGLLLEIGLIFAGLSMLGVDVLGGMKR